MDSNRALEHLNDLRATVGDDSDLAEMVDTLTSLVVLKQDISNPMLGARVTFYGYPLHKEYKRPLAEVDFDEDDWRVSFSSDNAEYWDGWEAPWYDGRRPEDYDYEVETLAVIREPFDPEAPYPYPRRAIVFEGNIAENAPDGPLWDENQQEYHTREEYPMGTVNLILADGYTNHSDPPSHAEFGEQYPSEVEVRTSVTPARGEPTRHQYTPGWE